MSREQILNKIKQNKPAVAVDLPTGISFPPNFDDNVLKFIDTLTGIGGSVVAICHQPSAISLYDAIKKNIEKEVFASSEDFLRKNIISRVAEINIGNVNLENISDPHDLSLIDVAILRGAFGVAENGAIWLDETQIGKHRVLPFITQHFVIILDKKNLVHNMHEAYKRLNISRIGFGVFIAGPSKTADIEQSLVIGAHGARSLRVYLV